MEQILYNISSSPSNLFSPDKAPSKYFNSLVSDVLNHPYPPVPSKIPFSQRFFESTIKPEVPFTIVFGYLALIAILNQRQDGKNRMKGPWWKALLLLHNVLLAVSELVLVISALY